MLPKTRKRLIDSNRWKTWLIAAGVKYNTVLLRLSSGSVTLHARKQSDHYSLVLGASLFAF